ncbi:MAG TPA: aldose epimerase family protein [Polyangiaceae bacterium]|nr:aldose epimerase family protein [Polyangiaceae bacterium]
MTVVESPFGKMPDGAPVGRFRLDDGEGVTVDVIGFGCRITSVRCPDRHGRSAEVALGFDRLDPYLRDENYFGPVCGRYCNRLGSAEIDLDGRKYVLSANDDSGPNTLHGGPFGLSNVLWRVRSIDGQAVQFEHTSPHLHGGFPGNLTTIATYSLEKTALHIRYSAVTDAPTVANLTQHLYLNLAGAGTADVLDHELTIAADEYTPFDQDEIPTGEIAPVAGTPFDFRSPRALGDRIRQVPGGYDHNFVIRSRGSFAEVARLTHAPTGRSVVLEADQPGLQLYTANRLDGSIHGVGGAFVRHGGVVLEPQHFPDSPHHPNFPSTRLNPGETLMTSLVFHFGVV